MKVLVARLLYWLKGLFEDPVALFQALGVQVDDTILEVGCAIGYHTLPLARIASEGTVYAVDVWEEGLARLQQRAASVETIEVMCRTAEAVELPSASLDTVVCFDTLHELAEPGEALRKWARFLKPGGKLFYRDPSLSSERIGPLSDGQLRHAATIQGVDVFVRRGPDQESARTNLDE